MPCRALIPIVLAAVAAVLAGCGNDRQQPPDVTTPGPPLGTVAQSYPKAGLRLRAPSGWQLDAGQAPLVVTMSTGRATLAIYRYPRTETLPRTHAQLTAALDALAGAAKARDATFTEIKRNTLRVDGQPAVQLRASETVEGQPRLVRSTHVYADGGEIVVDAFAPERDFRRVDAQVFRGVLRSLRIARPAA